MAAPRRPGHRRARRIGRAIALELAAHGWDVAVHYRHSRDEAEATGGRSCARPAHAPRPLPADLADEAACEAWCRRCCAPSAAWTPWSTTPRCSSYDDVAGFSYRAMDALARQHRAGRRAGARAAPRAARGRARAAAWSTCSTRSSGTRTPTTSYTLSKAALEAATTMLAQALAPRLRVCGVAPGVTLLSGDMNDAEFERRAPHDAAGRASTPEDVARAVRFLLESPGHHRHHAAGRRRPAPAAAGRAT
jgi:NAD(P)-dependent dehydrogenase (short-subunit alcohol dehydrogenase family)